MQEDKKMNTAPQNGEGSAVKDKVAKPQPDAGQPECAQEIPEEAPAQEIAELQAKLDALTQENAKYKDLYLRAAAEMKNQFARNEEAVKKAYAFSIEKFAKELVPVLDSMEKAVEAAQGADEATKKGIEATYRQLISALSASGMTSIEAKGRKFDPMLHHALTMVDGGKDTPSGCVAQVFQSGWVLNGRVIRAALVAVAK